MGGRVLGTEVDNYPLRAQIVPDFRALEDGLVEDFVRSLGFPGVGVETRRIVHVLPKGIAVLVVEVLPFRPAAGIGLAFFFKVRFSPVLPQGMPPEALPQEDAPQVGMTFKADAQKVPGLSFLEVGAGINVHQRGDHRVVPGNLHLEHQSRATGALVHVVDHLHLAFGEIVHAGKGGQIVVTVFVSQGFGEVLEVLHVHDVALIPFTGIGRNHASKTGFQFGDRHQCGHG